MTPSTFLTEVGPYSHTQTLAPYLTPGTRTCPPISNATRSCIYAATSCIMSNCEVYTSHDGLHSDVSPTQTLVIVISTPRTHGSGEKRGMVDDMPFFHPSFLYTLPIAISRSVGSGRPLLANIAWPCPSLLPTLAARRPHLRRTRNRKTSTISSIVASKCLTFSRTIIAHENGGGWRRLSVRMRRIGFEGSCAMVLMSFLVPVHYQHNATRQHSLLPAAHVCPTLELPLFRHHSSSHSQVGPRIRTHTYATLRSSIHANELLKSDIVAQDGMCTVDLTLCPSLALLASLLHLPVRMPTAPRFQSPSLLRLSDDRQRRRLLTRYRLHTGSAVLSAPALRSTPQ